MQDIFVRLHDDCIAASVGDHGLAISGPATALQMADVCKANVCLKLAYAEKCLEDGADEELQVRCAPF